MKKKIITTILICFVVITSSSVSNAQNEIKYKKKVPRNTWGIGLNYAENGFGPSVSFYNSIGKTTDLTLNLAFSGVADTREVERYDIFGNSIVVDKINRVFMMPLSIGIRKELFKNEIEGSFVPLMNFGVSPTLIFTNPYNISFFSALGYTQTHFAFGVYGGFGVNFTQSESTSLNVNLNYYYLPIVGEGVQSLVGSTINNVGGLLLSFGLNFMN